MTYLQSLPNFYQRVIVSFLLLCLLAIVLALSHTPPFGWLFLATFTTIQARALSEYYQLAKMKGFLPSIKLAVSTSAFFLLSRYMALQNETWAFLPPTILYVSLSACALSHMYKATESIPSLAITLFGLLYITFSLSWLLELNFRSDSLGNFLGAFWTVFAIAVTKAADMAAYFVGKTFGRHRLSPFLSPKKTIEGAVGGLIGSCVIASLLISFYPVNPLCVIPSVAEGAFLGLLMGLAAIFGDLVESLLKRDAHVKDSGSLPGLGGVLDLLDSLIFTIPLLYIYLRARAFL